VFIIHDDDDLTMMITITTIIVIATTNHICRQENPYGPELQGVHSLPFDVRERRHQTRGISSPLRLPFPQPQFYYFVGHRLCFGNADGVNLAFHHPLLHPDRFDRVLAASWSLAFDTKNKNTSKLLAVYCWHTSGSIQVQKLLPLS
jgi:hypothetical protein